MSKILKDRDMENNPRDVMTTVFGLKHCSGQIQDDEPSYQPEATL